MYLKCDGYFVGDGPISKYSDFMEIESAKKIVKYLSELFNHRFIMVQLHIRFHVSSNKSSNIW